MVVILVCLRISHQNDLILQKKGNLVFEKLYKLVLGCLFGWFDNLMQFVLRICLVLGW